ncbi:MAG TPA: 2-amino-4-hydroxy-6-hydroxymethyldihydropteridine diphosphokinase [Paludibacter sp.]|nr:2-amino-4-hydroxy-6-hydroxymethyldihydropteridine diphosphokinase [Paludibacter sp.]
MNTALIMLGSNINPVENIETAMEKLTEHFEIVSISSVEITQPVGAYYKNTFHNQALKILSVETADETKAIFKQIEIEMGRTPESKKNGDIPIDIDLIFWNKTLLHRDYERYDFVRRCVDEIR